MSSGLSACSAAQLASPPHSWAGPHRAEGGAFSGPVHSLSPARLPSLCSFSHQDSPRYPRPGRRPPRRHSSACSPLLGRLPQPWVPPVQRAPRAAPSSGRPLCLLCDRSSGPCPAHQAAPSRPQPRPPARDRTLLSSDRLHLCLSLLRRQDL